MSGLSRTPGKRVWVNPHRGFESRPHFSGLLIDGPMWPVLHFYPSSYPSCADAVSKIRLDHHLRLRPKQRQPPKPITLPIVNGQ